MFRAEYDRFANSPTLRLEGRFVGDWTEQAKSLVTKTSVPAGLIIDLTEVTYVDSVGEEVLIWFRVSGAMFLAETSYALDVCERLHLLLKENPSNSSGARHSGTVRRSSPTRVRAS